MKLPVLLFLLFGSIAASRLMGAGNLGVIAQREYLDAPWGSGIRFLATPMQDINPILNRSVVATQGVNLDLA